MKKFLLSLVLAALALPVVAQTKILLNLDASGVALQGYDPIAFFSEGRPLKGDPKLVSKRDGAIYFFASREHKAQFDADPAKYEPAFGGYCAYGVSRNRLVDIDVQAFQIMDGRLLLQYSKSARDKFNQDPKGNLSRAEVNWPGLVGKNGK